jgi:hypothetical protein
MELLTTVTFALIEAIKGAGLWAINSAEAIGAALIAVLTSTGLWSVAAVLAAVGGVLLYLVKSDRLLLV